MAGGRRKGGICRAVRQNVPEGVPPSGTFSFYRMGRRRAHGAGVFPAFFSRRGGPAAPVFSDLEYTMELLKFCLRGKIPVFPVFFLSAPGRGIGRSSVTMPGTPAMMTGAILPDTMDRHLPGTRKMPPITPGIIAASERFSRDKSPRTIPAGGPAAYWFAGGASSTGCLYSTAHCSACVGILFGECQKAGVAARSRCFFRFLPLPGGGSRFGIRTLRGPVQDWPRRW